MKVMKILWIYIAQWKENQKLKLDDKKVLAEKIKIAEMENNGISAILYFVKRLFVSTCDHFRNPASFYWSDVHWKSFHSISENFVPGNSERKNRSDG